MDMEMKRRLYASSAYSLPAAPSGAVSVEGIQALPSPVPESRRQQLSSKAWAGQSRISPS